MTLTLEQAVGQQLLLSFEGKRRPPSELLQALRRHPVGGIVLFRHRNVGSLRELRELTSALQAAAARSGQPPLLIAADQEGGQLMAIGDATPFPGNMALGAARDDSLAFRVGRAMGRELAALGVNVDFAPVCDVNNNPDNPVVGTRSFGDDPALVARLSAALVKGLQTAGVAATAKHFPGHGDTASDSHHGAPVVRRDAARIGRVELPPFRAAVAAGVKLVMTAHIVMPALNGGSELPATLSPQILRGLLRRRLGFRGLITTDAMDMKAIEQGAGLAADAMAAIAAGADLLLLNHELSRIEPVRQVLVQALKRGLLSRAESLASAQRVLALKRWLGRRRPPSLGVVGCVEHRRLAREVAARSVTLVRDDAGILPLRLPSRARLAVIVPRPADLTPADTSSQVVPSLASAVREHHPRVDELRVSMDPKAAEIRSVLTAAAAHDLVIVGTLNASTQPGQASLVRALLARRAPVIAVALRMPYDLAAFPAAPTYLCTYSILAPAMSALAAALWGRTPFAGRLPVKVRLDVEPRIVKGRKKPLTHCKAGANVRFSTL